MMRKMAQFQVWSLVFFLYLVTGALAACTAQSTDSAGVHRAENTENRGESTFSTASATAKSAPTATERPSFLSRVVNPPEKPQALRLVLWGGLSITEGLIAYDYTTDIWGEPNGKLHFKKDLRGDHMALSDEASHLFIGYKMAQAMQLGFRWSGLSPAVAARAGAAQAALYLTFVEFPMDAYNPKQGFGITDFVANLAGIGLAWYRAGRENPRCLRRKQTPGRSCAFERGGQRHVTLRVELCTGKPVA